MLDTIDILYIILAFCALWITAFICWFIYQLAVVLKHINDLVSELKWQAEKIEQALNGMKSKFETGSGHLASLTDHVKNYVSNKIKK